MDDFDLHQISAYVLKGKKQHNRPEFNRIYDLTFQAWHRTWENTYQQDFHSEKRLNSDTFTRQDEILSLFYRGQCFALCIFSHINMEEEFTLLDSYFNCWPEESIKKLASRGPNVITCTQYTVIEEFRREGPEELGKNPFRMLITGMIAKYFLESGMDAMSAITRVTKGIDKLSYKQGGVQLATGLFYEAGSDKAQVDLVAFFPEYVIPIFSKNPYVHIFDDIWARRNGRVIKVAA